MASIRKINGQFRVRFFLHLPSGGKVDRSRRVDKMSQARELKALADILEHATKRQEYTREDLEQWRRHGLIAEADLPALRVFEDGRKTVQQAADEYLATMECGNLERAARRVRVAHLVNLLGTETSIHSVRHFAGEAIKTKLRETYKAVTVNKHLQDLKRIFTLQLAHRCIEHHPFGVLRGCRTPKDEKIKPVALDHEQIAMVLTKAEEQDKLAGKTVTGRPLLDGHLVLFLLMFFGCGLRRNEALAARMENIDWRQRCLLLTETKTGEEREVGLGQRLYNLLLPRKGEKGKILPAFSRDYVSRAIIKHFARCGIKMRLHDTRHTYTTRLLDLGINNHEAMGRTGHKDSRMLGHYTHPEFGQVFEDQFPFMK
jgi:integrase